MHIQKSPIYTQKSPIYTQKSPTYTQKSPTYPQKSPTHTPHNPTYTQKSLHTLYRALQARNRALHILHETFCKKKRICGTCHTFDCAPGVGRKWRLCRFAHPAAASAPRLAVLLLSLAPAHYLNVYTYLSVYRALEYVYIYTFKEYRALLSACEALNVYIKNIYIYIT